uniref:Homeobox domain-containing protein n=1 Tax=Araucaria cunninghamii TaxID=56994 RepID=A0A0D6QUC4_ARACU
MSERICFEGRVIDPASHLAQRSRREKLRAQEIYNNAANQSGSFSNLMSQQTRRVPPHPAQAGVVDEMPGVYAAADTQMFSEIFNFPTGVELLGVPAKDDNVHGSKLNATNNSNWRVSNGHQQQYMSNDFAGQNMATSGGGAQFREGNVNMQGLHNVEAMQLYLMNPANGDYSGAPTPPPANMVISFPHNISMDHQGSAEISSHKNYAEVPLQFPTFPHSMGSQGLGIDQVPSNVRESWQGGGVNELLLLPTAGNGNLHNTTTNHQHQHQFTAAQLNNNNTVNWANRHVGSLQQPVTSQWCEQALGTKVGDGFRSRDDRSAQGLSLSLSSNSQMQVQSFETVKAKTQDVFNGAKLGNFSRSEGVLSGRGIWNPNAHGGGSAHMNMGSTGAFAGYLKHSKYMKPTQQLLDEFCNVAGKGVKNLHSGVPAKQDPHKFEEGKERESSFGGHHMASHSIAQTTRKIGSSVSISGNSAASAAAATGISNDSGKDQITFAVDRFELRRRKAKLLWMLDEVDRRYRHYCDQMRMVVTSFESAAGVGAAGTYTCLASKAMSRHFRCLKDAINGQIKSTNEALGEKESSLPGITKGETPRLKFIEQGLRQQRAFQQVGMLEQDAWRPQRGLPERAVTVLRAWLFEHFLHPYPSDADKHLLARQTGLSRSQVSNWFINARVRLWKPMVEEMYQEEAKEEEIRDKDTNPNNGNSHEKGGASDSNKSSEDLKPMAPESSCTMSLPLESQDEMFEFRGGGGEQIMSSSLTRNTSATNARKAAAEVMKSAEIREHADNANKVQGSEVGGLDFSGYNGGGSSSSGMFHQQNLTSTFFGSGDVSLTLGLRHSGALSVPVADQEKYHNALYLP